MHLIGDLVILKGVFNFLQKNKNKNNSVVLFKLALLEKSLMVE